MEAQMNHRIEMEYNKLLQMAASGRLQQVELQRKRLQTLDRNEEPLARPLVQD